jgi:S1-C subfamily serine protease
VSRRLVTRALQTVAVGLPLVLAGCCQDCARVTQLAALSANGPIAPGNSTLSTDSDPEAAAITQAPDAPLPAGAAANESVGAGIYVNAEGDLLATWEQISGCRSLAVLDDSVLVPARVIAGNPLRSLAILRTARPIARFARFQTALPATGTTVREVTYPISDGVPMPVAMTAGHLQSTQSPTGIEGVIQSSAQIEGQSPGGAIVDQRGDVIGIIVAKLDDAWPSGPTYGIASLPIARFASSAGIEIALSSATAVASEPAAAASDYVVPIVCFR